MNSVTIQPVSSRSGISRFLRFAETLYRDEPNWTPPTFVDDLRALSRKNPACEFCDFQCYLALRRHTVVGRVCAIVNHSANAKWGVNVVRFGWLDFVEDAEVLDALLGAVERFGRQYRCDTIKGPLGFTDMDKEGLLVEGFEHLSPFTCLYNFPYYGPMLNEAGFVKDVDWTQRVVSIGKEMPSMFQYADLVEQRFHVHVLKGVPRKRLIKQYGRKFFHTLNEAFLPLYQYSQLTDAQIDVYVKKYLSFLNLDFLSLVVNENDDIVGFCTTCPSLSKALRKCRGRFFPFGWIHLLQALRHNDSLDALLIGVLPEYQGKGVTLLLFKHLHEACIRYGIGQMILNPQLEDNFQVQSLFGEYETRPFARRRCYTKKIDPFDKRTTAPAALLN